MKAHNAPVSGMDKASVRETAIRLLLSVLMVLSVFSPLSLLMPQTALAAGTTMTTNVHTDTGVLSSWKQASAIPVTTGDRNNGDGTTTSLPATGPNNIYRQDITQKLYFRVDVNWADGATSGERAITINKPLNSTFTLGTDASTAAVVDSVSGTAASSTEVKIKLKSGMLPSIFNVFYTVEYDRSKTPNNLTTDFTPKLTIDSTPIASGDSLMVKTACETQVIPALRVSGDYSKTNGTFANYFSTMRTGFRSTDLARSGSLYSYTLNAVFESFFPDAPISATNYTGFVGASTPKTINATITLPEEAVLAGTPSGYSVSDDGNGRTVLTANATSSLAGLSYFYYAASGTTYVPQLTPFLVSYASPPVSGDSYLYDITVSGTWHDDTPFTKTISNIPHKYTSTPPVDNPLKLDVRARHSVDSKGASKYSNGAYSLLYETSTLALKDISNHTYQITNNGSAALKDIEVTLPFDGDIWDIKDFVLGYNKLSAGDLRDITFVYSDSTPDKTVPFSDVSKFVQAQFINFNSPYVTYPSIDIGTWSVDGLPSTSYIKGIKITVKDLAVGEELQFGLRTQLREVRRSGNAVVPGVDTANAKMAVTAKAQVDESQTITKDSESKSYPIYAVGQNPSSPISTTVDQTGVAAAYGVGEVVSIQNVWAFHIPEKYYNGTYIKPQAVIVVPDYLTLDTDSVKLEKGAGANTATYTQVSSSDITITGPEHRNVTNGTDAGSYSLYYVGYAGDTSYFGDRALRLSYNVKIPSSAPGGSSKIETFWTERSGANVGTGSGTVLSNYLDLNGRTGGNLAGAKSTFQINVPSSMTVAVSANGDKESATTWKEDGIDGASLNVANLARVKNTGTMRLDVINGTSSNISGVSYAQVPQGDFIPRVASWEAKASDLDDPGYSSSPEIDMYYTLNGSADMKSIPTGEWVYAATPSAIPANAKAFKLATVGSDVLPGRKQITYMVTFSIPAGASDGQIVRGRCQSALSVGTVFTNYAGFRVSKPSLTINYFQDNTSVGNLKGQTTTTTYDLNDTVNLPAGTAEGELNWKHPGIGYKTNGTQSPANYVMLETGNTVNVIYEKKTFDVKVEYYKQGEVTPIATDATTLVNQPWNSTIAMTPALLNAHQPTSGYVAGTADCGNTYTVVDGTNTIKITYNKKANLTAQIIYHKGSATGEVIGRSALIPSQTFDSVLTPTSVQLDAMKPSSGYLGGQAVEAPWTIEDTALNEFHVYYPIKQNIPYSIDYYNGSVTAANKVGTQANAGTGSFDETITLTPAQLNVYGTPASDNGFEPDGVQVPTIYKIVDGTNIINVVYPKASGLTVKVNYVKELINASGVVTTQSITVDTLPSTYSEGDVITLTSGELAAKHPGAGYVAGAQQGGDSFTVSAMGSDTITVLYKLKTDIPYTIEYYKEKADGTLGEMIYRSNVLTGTFSERIDLDAATKNAQAPATGYVTTGVQVGGTYTLAASNNVIKVSYPIKKDLSVSIVYYKDSVSAGNKLGETSIDGVTFNSQIAISGTGTAEGEPNWKKAAAGAGYGDGVVSPTTLTVVDGANTINVVYSKLSYAVTVNYYTDSVAPENLVGTHALGNCTYGSSVTLANDTNAGGVNWKKPATGYKDGSYPAFTVSTSGNTINVLYTKKDNLTYTVEYRKDSETGTVIGMSDAIGSQTFDSSITLPASGNGSLDAMKPAGFGNGVMANTSQKIVDGTNKVIVYYPRSNYGYTVKYYKDALNSTGYMTGMDELSPADVPFESKVVLTAAQLDAHKPAGYFSGVQQGDASGYTIAVSGNVISVLYSQDASYTYSLEYYIDEIAGAPAYVKTYSNQALGASINLPSSGDGSLDYKMPAVGYNSGVRSGATVVGETAADSVVKILYTKKTNLSYTIEYYKDSLSALNQITPNKVVSGQTFGTAIDASGDVDEKLPVGYQSGVVQSGSATTVGDPSAGNIVRVLYSPRTDIDYTVKYYKGSVAAGNEIAGTEYAGTGTFNATATAPNVASNCPTGYVAPTTGISTTLASVTGNTINVVYTPRTDLIATVKYMKRVDGSLVSAGNDSFVYGQTFGAAAVTTGVNLDLRKPAEGYASGIIQTSTLPTIGLDTDDNVITVVYEPRTDCTYRVEYRKGSATGAVIGTEDVTGVTYGSNVDLDTATLDAKRPAGYGPGVQAVTPYVAGVTGTVVVYYPALTDNLVQFKYFTEDITAGQFTQIATVTVPGYTTDADIDVTAAQKNAQKPVGFADGVVRSTSDATVSVGTSTVEIEYPRLRDREVTVRYFAEQLPAPRSAFSVLSTSLVGYTYLGAATLEDQVFGDTVTVPAGIAAGELDYAALKPAVGFVDGDQYDSPTVLVTGTEVHVLYNRKTDLTATVTYYKQGNATPLGTAMLSNLIFGESVTLAAGSAKGQIDYLKPAHHKSGTQAPAPLVVADGENNITVTYTDANTAPKVTANKVLHVTKGVTLSQAQFLKAVAAAASDKEDGAYPTSRIKIKNWSAIKWSTVNFPGSPYLVTLTVTDDDGVESAPITVAVFVHEAGDGEITPVDPKDPNIPAPAPKGYAWGKDSKGNYVLFKKGTNFGTTSTTSSSGSKTGDESTALLISAFGIAMSALAVVFSMKRRKKDDVTAS